VVEILRARVSNANNETFEQAEFSLHRITTLGTPTATTVTPVKHEKGSPAAASTVKGNVTASEPTYETDGPIDAQGVSTANGWIFDPLPEERPVISPSESHGVRLLSNIASTNLKVSLTFREIGG
jgi:hypothetical protein